MEDNELIAQVLDGKVDIFGKLIERYQRQLYYFVIGKIAEHTEAQDIVQKSFVTAYQNLSQFTTGATFFPWVKGIALNHCRNEWRRYHSQATMKDRLLEAKRAELEMLWLEERHHEGDARISALRECLQRLDPTEQNLVERRFVQEMSMAEIGRDLSKGGEAVRLWLYRVRVRLAECVKRRMSLTESMETT
jgi:RNA polymerase sigma-70 factor (ECF subfamily)